MNELGPLTRAIRTPIDSALDREVELQKNVEKEKGDWESVETLSLGAISMKHGKGNPFAKRTILPWGEWNRLAACFHHRVAH